MPLTLEKWEGFGGKVEGISLVSSYCIFDQVDTVDTVDT